MKKLLLLSSVLIGSVYLFGKRKVDSYQEAFKKLKILPQSITDVYLNGGKFTGNVVLAITNNSQTNLVLDTYGQAALKRLLFYTHKGNLIGEAFPNLTSFEVGPGETKPTEQIPVEIPINLESLITVGVDLIQNSKDIKVVPEIEVLGKTYTIS